MELMPALEIGWLNGWVPLGLMALTEGLLLLLVPREVAARLFDRSGWSKKQAVLTIGGKLFSLATLVLIALTPLKVGSGVFVAWVVVYLLGLAGLVVAVLDFAHTPLGQPVTGRLYTVSRHPQIVMLFFIFLGICLAIGSWVALLTLLASKLLQHWGILAEEEACLRQYGESYQDYLRRVPRYLLFF